MRDQVTFEVPSMLEVELLEALAGREPRGGDAPFAPVGLSGGDLALQAGYVFEEGRIVKNRT